VFALPNPGRESIRFYMNIERVCDVRLKIYNLNGELTADLHAAGIGPGAAVTWNCAGAARGIYVVRVLQDGREIIRMKVALVR